MEIIEQYIRAKHSDDDCEDGMVTSPYFVAVIDGSTSKTTRHIHPAMKNGRFCMTLVRQMIQEMPAETTLQEFCRNITAAVASHYPQGILPVAHERLCASAAIWSGHWQQLWMVGDCQALIDGKLYENDKPYEQRLATMRAAAFAEQLAAHPDMVSEGVLGHDYARDIVIPHLLQAMQGQNKQYAVIDGTPICMQGVRCVTFPEPPKEIILATDGYPFLLPTLEESEAALAKQLKQDPFNINTYLATKGLMKGNCSFDDRCYIRFKD